MMGNWEKQQEEKKEVKEKDKVRRENLAKYFYDLSKLTFTGLVIGSFATFLSKDTMDIKYMIYPVIAGSTVTYMLAWLGNRILK